MARRSHGPRWAHDGEHARPVARAREDAAHLYPRWIARRSRCPRRRAGPARRAPRSPQDSLLSPARLDGARERLARARLIAGYVASARRLSPGQTRFDYLLARSSRRLHHVIDDAQRTERT